MAVRLALLGLLACLTVGQQSRFASNLTLWASAVDATPTLARPALNYAVALIKDGQIPEGVTWLVRAGDLTASDPRGTEYRAHIRRQLFMLEAMGHLVCDEPSAQRYCYS